MNIVEKEDEMNLLKQNWIESEKRIEILVYMCLKISLKKLTTIMMKSYSLKLFPFTFPWLVYLQILVFFLIFKFFKSINS